MTESDRLVSLAEANKVFVRKSVSGINLKNTGSTLIYTTENEGKRFIPTKVSVEITTADTIAVAAAASIGTNSTDYNNVLAITTLTGLTAANLALNVPIVLAVSSVAVNTGIYFKVTTGATATTATGRVDLEGYYV